VTACPACKLPLETTGAIYHASYEGVAFAYAICGACYRRLRSLPASTRIKALNRAADAVAAHPERFPHKAFAAKDEAVVYAGLVAKRIHCAADLDDYLVRL